MYYFCLQYGCCFNFTDSQCTPHILTHYLGGDVSTLREDISTFVNGNVHWINKVCGNTLNSRDIHLDSYLNDIVEPGVVFDDVALMIVAMMSGTHILVLCKDTFRMTRPNNQFEDCPIQLAYYGDFLFKQVCPITEGATELLGTSTETLLDKQPDMYVETVNIDTSENRNQPIPPAEDQDKTIVDDKHQSQPVVEDEHSDIELDLKDTGILLSDHGEEHENEDIVMSNENEKLDGQSETVEIENKEVDVDVQDPQQVGMDINDNVQAKETDQQNSEARHRKKLVVLLEKYSEIENNRNEKKNRELKESETEQDSKDASDSGIETDGWVPKGVAKKKEKWIKKQTQTIPTTDGSLSVRTVSRPKWIPRKRKHQCHLCAEMFEMQCNFTKHYAMKHPHQPFQCEHCGATMKTPN